MPEPDRRFALIVASSDFPRYPALQPLTAPAQDAADLARVLGDPAIGAFDDVRTLVNRPSHLVRRAIEAFLCAEERRRDDLLLLYFSGHGIKDHDGQLYLAMTDTERGLYHSTAIPASFLNEAMAASRSRRQVLILDCCYGGAFARGMAAKGGESVDIRERFEGRGRVVLTASTATQYAFQDDGAAPAVAGHGGRSIFTRCLIEGLESGAADRDGDGWVSLDELYEYVYERVVDEMPAQTPGKWTFDLTGRILIARAPHTAVLTPRPGSKTDALPIPAEEAKRVYLRELRGVLDTRFSKEELRTLCFDLGVDYDNLPGESKSLKAAELIAYLDRRGRLLQLIEIGRRARPDIRWKEPPAP